jgi:hypothetical protein
MIWKCLLPLMVYALVPPASGQGVPGVDIEGPFARVKRNDDGSRTTFERGQDESTLTKTTVSPGGNVTMKTIYRLDSDGNPVKCDIYDGLGNKLYKTAFGYSKRPGVTYGKLVQELLYDVRVKRYFDGTREEKPVHMFVYRYNTDGSPRLPIGITLIEGGTAEEIFGRDIESQTLPDLDELEEGSPANPNARPLRRDR